MKQQIANRLGVAHVRDTVMQLVAGTITREQAMESLEIGKTRLYELKASYLAASRMPSLPQGMRRVVFGPVLQGFFAIWASVGDICGQGGILSRRGWVADAAGRRLKFYDISFVFANSPESKGKIERIHVVWQDRLPAYFEREGIGMCASMDDVNDHVERLVDYRNVFEFHREIGMTPQEAWGKAVSEGRSKLRSIPRDGWWELVWSEWTCAVVGPRGRIPVDGRFCPTECANGTKVWLCHHVDGTLSAVLKKPEQGVRPIVLFSNNPKVRNG